MVRIVSKRKRDEQLKEVAEVDIELQLYSDDELDELIRKTQQVADEEDAGFYNEDWVIQGRQAFEGLRLVEDVCALQQNWDYFYNYKIEAFTIRTPGAMVSLTEEFIQSLSMPIKQYLLDYNKP